MTSTVLLASIEAAGKTALASALLKYLMGKGKKVGYFVPLEIKEQKSHKQEGIDLISDILGLGEECRAQKPIQISGIDLWNKLSGDSAELLEQIRSNFNRLSSGREFVVVEGLSGLSIDGAATLACFKLSEILKAPVIIMMRYVPGMDLRKLAKVKDELGERLAGVIVNNMPQQNLARLYQQMAVKFTQAGIRLVGSIAEDRTLLGISVEELARSLGGNIAVSRKNAGRQVSNVMLGAMSLDSGLGYFSRRNDKAVVISSERSDIQLAALETSTSCLVLAGNTPPLQAVLYAAERKGVPIVLVPRKTEDVVNGLGDAFGGSRFNNKEKFYKFQDLARSLDLTALYGASTPQN